MNVSFPWLGTRTNVSTFFPQFEGSQFTLTDQTTVQFLTKQEVLLTCIGTLQMDKSYLIDYQGLAGSEKKQKTKFIRTFLQTYAHDESTEEIIREEIVQRAINQIDRHIRDNQNEMHEKLVPLCQRIPLIEDIRRICLPSNAPPSIQQALSEQSYVLIKIPDKSLKIICRHCSKKTLQNLLLTSKKLYKRLTTPFSFEFPIVTLHIPVTNALNEIKKNPEIYKHFSIELQTDPEVVTQFIKMLPECIDELPRTIKRGNPKLYTSLKKIAYLSASLHFRLPQYLQKNGVNYDLRLQAFARQIKDKSKVSLLQMAQNDQEFAEILAQVCPETAEPLAIRFPINQEIVVQTVDAFKRASFILKYNKSILIKTIHNLVICQNYRDAISLEEIFNSSTTIFQDDQEILTEAVHQTPVAFMFASRRLQGDKDLALLTMQSCGGYLKQVDNRLKNDKEVVLTAVTSQGNALQYASGRLKDDKDLVLAAVRNDGNALEFASNRLRNDKQVVLAALEKNGNAFVYVGDHIKNDKDVTIAIVRHNGLALAQANNLLRDDTDVVQTAVQQNALAFQYASDRLKDDLAVVHITINKNGLMLEQASDRFKNNIHIVRVAVQQCGRALEFASNRLQDDRSIVLRAIKQEPFSLIYATDRMKDDKEVVLVAVQINGQVLMHASDRLKDDKEVVLQAIRKNNYAFKNASLRLQSDPDILKEMLPDILKFFQTFFVPEPLDFWKRT